MFWQEKVAILKPVFMPSLYSSKNLESHEKALYIGPAKYATGHVEMTSYTIAPSGTTWIQRNAFFGKCPRRIIFSFIKASAVYGVYHRNLLTLNVFISSARL